MNRRQMMLSCLGLVTATLTGSDTLQSRPSTKYVLQLWDTSLEFDSSHRPTRYTTVVFRLARPGEQYATENLSQFTPLLEPGFQRILCDYAVDKTGTELRCKWVDREMV